MIVDLPCHFKHNMKYNSKIYLELLKYDQSFKKDGTSLQEQYKEKYLKLLNYSVNLSDHVHWQQKMII